MRTWLKVTYTTAILLASAVAVQRFLAAPPAPRNPPQGPNITPATRTASSSREALARCLENAQLIHELHWASACMLVAEQARSRSAECQGKAPQIGHAERRQQDCDRALAPVDDSPDCMLPPDRAAVLNAALSVAERRCMDEAASAAPR